jgi:hemerythrin superfamily protein
LAASGTGHGVAMDALALLKEDHRTVSGLFEQFRGASDRARKTKERLARKMVEELSVHAYLEEHLFYPAVRAAGGELEDEVLEAIEEHHIVKWVLSEIEKLDPAAESFDAKVTVLMENVEHHVKEEERTLFPAVRKALSRQELAELGERMAAQKQGAPRRPELEVAA